MTLLRGLPLTLVVGFGLACTPLGCTSDVDRGENAVGALAAVPVTPIKLQAIGNCWAYATAAWVESLHKGATDETLDVSEAYITYWSWLKKITQDNADDADRDEIGTGASWGKAVEILRRYGVYTGAFVPGDKQREGGDRQQAALVAINASLVSGPLETLGARRDKVLVRRELNRAWRLPSDLVAKLDHAFGPDGETTFLNTATKHGLPLVRVDELPVRSRDPGTGGLGTFSLADVIGARRQGGTWDDRTGRLAWSVAQPPVAPDEQRAFVRRIQRALHEGTAVPLTWNIDPLRIRPDGSFTGKTTRKLTWHPHLSVVIDYQVDAPPFGVLPAGTPETRSAALAAALSDHARVEFLRVKNSWGTAPVGRATEFAGTDDLYMDYLFDVAPACTEGEPSTCGNWINLVAAVLPPE